MSGVVSGHQEMLFDTDVFLWAQRGNHHAAKLIDGVELRFISIQSHMEFLRGSVDARQLKLNKDFFKDMSFTTLGLTERIGHRAAIYIESYCLSHGLRTGDAIVAATAMEHNLTLATSNIKHYRHIPNLTLKQLKP